MGAGLIALAIRTLPAPAGPASGRGGEPNGAVILVAAILAVLVGYPVAHRRSTSFSASRAPGYLAATGMPLLAAGAGGVLAVLAARRGGAAALASAGGLALAWAAVQVAIQAADALWLRTAGRRVASESR